MIIKKITIITLRLMLTLISFWQLNAYGEYRDPITRTNVNEVDPLFNEKIDNYRGFEQMLEGQKATAVRGSEAATGSDDLACSNEVPAKASKLGAIRAGDLDDMGRNESLKENWLSDYLIDYSKPGMMQHKEDAERITAATGEMMKGLLGLLKKLDIDCSQVKGPREIEPQYHIQLERRLDRNKGDTVYEQVFCERLRNRYNCNDSLAMRCKRSGIAYGPWQDKQIRVPGGELVNFGKAVFWVDHVARRCFEYKLTVGKRRYFFGEIPPDPYVVQSIREFLATKHANATIDNISPEMSSYWEGGIFSIDGWTYLGRVLGSKDYAWNSYIINYKYREGKPACFEWSKTWTERCTLN